MLPSDINQLFSEALNHQLNGQIEQALSKFKAILDAQPDHSESLHLVGLIYLHRGDITNAISSIKTSLAYDPQNSHALSNLAYCFNLLGKPKDATSCSEEACRIDPTNHGGWINLGNAQRRLGLLDAAQISYKTALNLQPDNPRYLFNLANSYYELKDFQTASELFRKCLSIDPKIPEAHNNLSVCLVKLKDPASALSHTNLAVQLKPDYALAWNNQGNALTELARFKEALVSYDRSIGLRADDAETWRNRANALYLLGQYSEALASYDRAVKLKPDSAQAWNGRGQVLIDLKHYEEALASYDMSLKLVPDSAKPWGNRGYVLNCLRRHREALVSYDKSISLMADNAECFSHRGNTLASLMHLKEALVSYDRSIELRADDAETWINRGITLSLLGQYSEAIVSYDRAIELKPDSAEAWSSRGHALIDLKHYEEGLESLEIALKIKPSGQFWLGNLLHNKMKICDWTDLDLHLAELENETTKGVNLLSPFVALGLFDSPKLQRFCADAYIKSKTEFLGGQVYPKQRLGQIKIRIGYFSADFIEHPVSHLIAEMIELHDRNLFEIYGFSFARGASGFMHDRMKNAFDQFFDVALVDDIGIIQLTHQLGIDIAFDLGGHTRESRPEIFAGRVAPIQINYLGYPGTWGGKYMDYFIGDPITITDQNREYFTEKIIFMPHSFQINPSRRPIVSSRNSREYYGLPEKYFVFCCFNNTWKIMPNIFFRWMHILREVPNSVLWLYADNRSAITNLRKAAIENKISGERLIFAESVSRENYMAQLQFADLFLDTLPYNAGTTASDALWAGLPIVTLAGRSFAGRMAASLLQNIGVPELITENIEAYESLAIELATKPVKLAAIKRALAQNRSKTPLFDTHLFTRHIESACRVIYDRYQAGLPVDHIYVGRSPVG